MNDTAAYSFRRLYHLCAQTPLIHFQYDQSNATLRAAEVKPRLDHFLWQRAGERIEDSWLLHRTRKALRYKLRIERGGYTRVIDLTKNRDYDIYYGHLGGGADLKKAVLGDARLTVLCTIPALRDFIEEHLAEFFAVTNFGMMQSKGFGSYILQDAEYTPPFIAESLKRTYGASTCYTFDGGQRPFKVIKIMYKLMKSGVNLVRFRGEEAYERSLLFQFMHEQYGIGNEKAWLKQNGLAPSDIGSYDNRWHANPSEHTAQYVRALLGLGEHLDYTGDREQHREKTVIRIKSVSGLERLPSPIFFKVIGGNVYFVAAPVAPAILGETFEFTSPNGSGTLTVPTKEQLDADFTERFLAYCKDRFNNGVLDKFRETRGVTVQEVGE